MDPADYVIILISAASSLFSSLLAAGIFYGSVKSTLRAHEQRIQTLENDIRYEIRVLREEITRLRESVMPFRTKLVD